LRQARPPISGLIDSAYGSPLYPEKPQPAKIRNYYESTKNSWQDHDGNKSAASALAANFSPVLTPREGKLFRAPHRLPGVRHVAHGIKQGSVFALRVRLSGPDQ
jgi:hypothetical protein